MHVVDRVLDVRRVGSGLQVLIRWRGSGHEDEWKPYAQCNPPSQREAKAIERIKFPARGAKRTVPAMPRSGAASECEVRADRGRGGEEAAHVGRKGVAAESGVACRADVQPGSGSVWRGGGKEQEGVADPMGTALGRRYAGKVVDVLARGSEEGGGGGCARRELAGWRYGKQEEARRQYLM